MLSHRNVLANCAQCLARIDTNGQDLVFNALPVFHSFGLTGGLIMPQVGGVPTFLYPSPVHYRIVPEFIYDTGATVLFGTNTFLADYARRASLRSAQRASGGGRRGGGERRRAHGLHEQVRRAHPGGLRRHRDRAGGR